jgi:hypothetical protein
MVKLGTLSATLDLISIQVSAALFQNKPTVFFSLKNNIIFVKNVQ